MCGISGFMTKDLSFGDERLRSIVLQMTDRLRHRGPDDADVWTDPKAGVALGHRRLSILDLSAAGRQPMTSACGRFVITYNGEVYNFQKLRRELEALGHGFRGHSDTEVVLASIAQWGVEAALPRMNGMFAFGLWDGEQRTLTLARDRVGKKPLYYGWCGDTFLFGSELKALRAHPSFDPQLDTDAVGLFVQYSWIPAPYCIYKRLRKLPPGSLITITPGTPGHSTEATAPRAYWSARAVAEQGNRIPYEGSMEDAAGALDTLLRDAVSCRMVADVSLGALLSGGIDSTTVVSLMQATSTRPVRTFSIGFHEPAFNEAPYAKAIAQHLGTEHTELYVSAQDGLGIIPDLPTIYDEPFADPSQIPTVMVSRLARQQVTVALSGDGGDELFAGYRRYANCARRWNACRWIPRAARRGLGAALGAANRASWSMFGSPGTRAALAVTTRQSLVSRLDKVARWLPAATPFELFERTHARCLSAAEFVQGAQRPPTVLNDPDRWPAVTKPMQGFMYLDFADCLTDDILVKVDRASMSVGLEVRCPLLDARVVEFAWSLPLEMRVDRKGGKRILRKVLARYVPEALTERRKMGFGVPVAEWLRGPLREWGEDLLDDKRICEQGLLRPQAVRLVWQQHLSGWQNHDALLWNLLMFQGWLRTNA